MSLAGSAQLFDLLAVQLLTVRPLGRYMQRVFAGERTRLSPLLRPMEAAVYGVA